MIGEKKSFVELLLFGLSICMPACSYYYTITKQLPVMTGLVPRLQPIFLQSHPEM